METIEGKARWIHCTPLTGSDGKVGVIMIIMVDKQDTSLSHTSLMEVQESNPAGARIVGPVPARARVKSHSSLREPDHTPERYQPCSSPLSASPSGTPPRGRSFENPRVRSMGGSRLYADYMKEIRETQKRPDSFSTRPREREEHSAGLGSMAKAVAVKAVNGKGRTKKIGGTY